ncbi:hypothetical protein MVLG_03420 [Microbotryum lychnidis-dioicae p1A1 Lamole]|uniref:Uncharacterized protein n=1 Tax=Microbotryum lychnidis-dioicae (strain p1A1 Lamole / MvSl-1064) TaxID=683840 RepID=U5H853_USTV1|nr:hypothetical protein MVLG_03420 [Microbotryum lychnidis-dioicae p1A1 Lamole]|eukprot:KDE06261.1 hypothetical protein MVLG_03420 [Microbotryum lychnidis-dioicae p1A1 Lamole]
MPSNFEAMPVPVPSITPLKRHLVRPTAAMRFASIFSATAFLSLTMAAMAAAAAAAVDISTPSATGLHYLFYDVEFKMVHPTAA